jgi:hypothetical protein
MVSMTADGWDVESTPATPGDRAAGLGLALALAALAAVGASIAIQQLMDRRLSKPEMARLRFYRYLRERGRLES